MSKFCISCGTRKRLTWPRHDRKYCAMRCAAEAFDNLHEASGQLGYCTDCGECLDATGGHTCAGEEPLYDRRIHG